MSFKLGGVIWNDDGTLASFDKTVITEPIKLVRDKAPQIIEGENIMSEALEAFRRFRDNAKFDNKSDYYLSTQYIDDNDIIESALKEVSGEDRAFLSDIKKGKLHPLTTQCYQDLLKKRRALEIIKEKKVDVQFIMEHPEAKNVFWYNSSFTGALCEGWRMLSQEEYDLVRKVLL